MEEPTARRAAEEARTSSKVPADYLLESAQRKIIELAERGSETPSRVRDCLAWVVRFTGDFGWCDLAIEEATGRVVRVERSK